MVSQRIHGTAETISYYQLPKTFFSALARFSVIRRRVHRLSTPANWRCHVCYYERFHVPLWSEPWSEHHPLALCDCDLPCFVVRCHLRIICYCHADRRRLVVARLVCGHFLVTHYSSSPSPPPLFCASPLIISALRSPAVCLLSLNLLHRFGMYSI